MTKILIDEAVVRQAICGLERIDHASEAERIESAAALRKALSDAALDALLDKMADNARELGLSYEQPAQQEPVAWYGVNIAGVKYLGWKYEELDDRGFEVFPLYTHPQAREWVGLTDEERHACTQSPFTADNYLAIEAKLMEKNT